MAFRKVHPYERKNIPQEKEDVAKTYKNQSLALSLFSLFTILMVFVYILLYAFVFSKTDMSLFVLAFLICLIAFSIKGFLLKILSRLFKDPSKGVYIMSFLIVAPFMMSVLLWTNSWITFESKEEKIKIIGHDVYRSRRGSPTYVIILENDQYKFQPGFRGFNSVPSSGYVNYQFRRGILGFRILQNTYITDY